MIFTLRLKDEEALKSRVLNASRSSEYRDYEESLRLNRELYNREPYRNEVFIDVEEQAAEKIVNEILDQIG